MARQKETKNEDRKRKQQEQQNDRANADPIWRNVTEQMRQDFLEAVVKINNVDLAKGKPIALDMHEIT